MNGMSTLGAKAILVGMAVALVVPGDVRASEASQDLANTHAAEDGGRDHTPPGPLVRQRLTPLTTITVDDDAYHWNMQGFDQEKVVTVGEYQYTLYWDASTNLTLVRRDLGDDTVQTLTFPDRVSADDSHRNTALGVSAKDGRLHLVYDHHNNPINYRVSRPGYLSSPPESLSLDDFSAKRTILDEAEQRATYPRFVNDKDGDLYFIYRHGGSGNGTTILGRYDSTSGTWHRVGRLFSRLGRYPPWNDSPTRNAYLSGVLFDDEDRLHVSWLYREAGAATRSNHDVHYAYSDDYGLTWHNNDGTQIADLAEDDPIRIDDPGIVVVPVPGNTGLRGQSGLALDSDNQPHVLSIQSTVTTSDRTQLNQHYIHHWRRSDGSWHSSYIDDISVPYTDRLRRGNIAIDERDNVHVYIPYRGTLWAARAEKRHDWQDWDLYSLPTDHPVADFPAADGTAFDRTRWINEGILTIPVEVVIGSRTGFALLDFSVKPTIIAPPGRRPATPALSVSARLGSSDRGFRLRWPTVHAAEFGYNVYRRDLDHGGAELVASHVAANSLNDGYLDTDITIGANYAYHVRAANRFGESAPSNIVYASIRDRGLGDWSDYRVEFDFSEISARTLAVVFRQQDTCHLYSWQITEIAGGQWVTRPVRIDECNQRRLRDNVPLPFSPGGGDVHRMAVNLQGDDIVTYLDGEPFFELQESTYEAGLVGFRTSLAGGPAFIDNVRVTDSSGAVLFADDFSSGENPFVADGPRRCDAEVVDGMLRIPSGDWCRLSPLHAVIDDSPPADA